MFALISFFFDCVLFLSLPMFHLNLYTQCIRLVHNLIVVLSRKITELMHHLRTSTPQFKIVFIFCHLTNTRRLMIGIARSAQTAQYTQFSQDQEQEKTISLRARFNALWIPSILLLFLVLMLPLLLPLLTSSLLWPLSVRKIICVLWLFGQSSNDYRK